MRNASAGHAGFARIMIGHGIQGLVKGDFTVWRAIGVRVNPWHSVHLFEEQASLRCVKVPHYKLHSA